MYLSVRQMGRKGELKWQKPIYEGYYKWVTIYHWPVRKPVSPHFKMQKSLSCLSVIKHHKQQLSQWFDGQAGKPSIILVISVKWPRGLTYSSLPVVRSFLSFWLCTIFSFSLSLRSQNMICLLFESPRWRTKPTISTVYLGVFPRPFAWLQQPECEKHVSQARGTLCLPQQSAAESFSAADPVSVHQTVLQENKPLQGAIKLPEKGQSCFSVFYMFHACQMVIRMCPKPGRH